MISSAIVSRDTREDLIAKDPFAIPSEIHGTAAIFP
jgi:hypothetical protein